MSNFILDFIFLYKNIWYNDIFKLPRKQCLETNKNIFTLSKCRYTKDKDKRYVLNTTVHNTHYWKYYFHLTTKFYFVILHYYLFYLFRKKTYYIDCSTPPPRYKTILVFRNHLVRYRFF